jgi:hypothetical protein
MDMKMFIPVYGPIMEMKRIQESDDAFIEKAYDAVIVGAIIGTETIFALQHAAHLAAVGEGSAFSAMAVKRAQNLVRGGPAVATAMIAVGMYGKAITPRADVETGRYGSVRVTLGLMGGYY